MIEWGGYPGPLPVRKNEFRGHYTYHRGSARFGHYRLSYDPGVHAIPRDPQVMAEDDLGLGAEDVVACEKTHAHKGLNSKRFEPVRGHPCGSKELGISTFAQSDRAVSCMRGETLKAGLPLDEPIVEAQWHVMANPARFLVNHDDAVEPVGFREWQTFVKQSVDEPKGDCSQADAKSHRDDRNARDSGTL